MLHVICGLSNKFMHITQFTLWSHSPYLSQFGSEGDESSENIVLFNLNLQIPVRLGGLYVIFK